jgi:hypothetical protein
MPNTLRQPLTIPAFVLATLTILAVVAVTNVVSAGTPDEVDSQAALNDGNRLFREHQLEAAVEAYRAGYSPAAPHPTLLYNLGTTLHHLGHLPEAILWYRRATTSGDTWLQENLWLARRSLGSQQLPPGGLLGWFGNHIGLLQSMAIAFSWATLLLLIAWSRVPLWLPIVGAFVAASLFGSTLALERWGPHPAVILEDCSTVAGDVPAGTEAWGSRRIEGGWNLSGIAGMVCPPESIELLFPTS